MAKFKCLLCNDHYTSLEGLYDHIDDDHDDSIPKNFTPARYYHYLKTGRTHGKCVVCGKPTEWNEITNKYHRFCSDPNCKKKYREQFKKRMIGKYGKVTLLNDPDQQKKMLANRSISGTYKWSDGSQKTYTGTYELDFLKFLDSFMNFDSADVMTPSPHTYYYSYEGEKKFYFPDVFIPSLNLEIEVKDGGNNPNMHHKIQEVDKVKEKLKDDVMNSQKEFDYIKIINKNYDSLLKYLLSQKKKFINENKINFNNYPNVITESYDILQKSYDSTMNINNSMFEIDYVDDILEMSISSNLDKDHVTTKKISLNTFNKIKLTSDSVNKYKTSCSSLKHIRTGQDYIGYIFIDKNDNVGAYICVNTNTHTGTALEITSNYQGHGLSHEIMKLAIHELHMDNLTVNKKNNIAISLYKKYNFTIYKETDTMYFMKLKSSVMTENTKHIHYVEENSTSNKKMHPIYAILFSNDTDFGKKIRKITGSPYSHATVTLDPSLNDMYSFSDIPYNHASFNGAGFVRESLWSPMYRKNNYFTVLVTFTDDEGLYRFKDKLEIFKQNYTKYKYNDIGLLQYYLNMKNTKKHNEKKKMRWFCSEFVSYMLYSGRKEEFQDILQSPDDIQYINDMIVIGDYNLQSFTENDLKHKTQKAYAEYLTKKSDIINENTFDTIDNLLTDEDYQSLLEVRHKDSIKKESDITPYTAILDWKYLYNQFVSIFPDVNSDLRFDLFEIIIRNYIVPLRINVDNTTHTIIDELLKIKSVIYKNFGKITDIDILARTIKFEKNNKETFIIYPNLTVRR